MASNRYAIDGLCHNENYGTFGHECGKPAVWLADKPSKIFPPTFTSGFCDRCRREGDEAPAYSNWRPLVAAPIGRSER